MQHLVVAAGLKRGFSAKKCHGPVWYLCFGFRAMRKDELWHEESLIGKQPGPYFYLGLHAITAS